ncbi:hypothetical protein THAOC_37886 [Thalassiosira oceanica]|uniref:Uncharacterized protein n=1 Tax=Thalassiosira oceanica TaxID=159749 RepID=K0QZH8_THAOC|nr:hypothetical protein THAOC_37886 [Thalassiosira oceanica]|eukprot:EJK43649.1 hypothetical protein THAOC_37886 [Thalassiosira oceanica]
MQYQSSSRVAKEGQTGVGVEAQRVPSAFAPPGGARVTEAQLAPPRAALAVRPWIPVHRAMTQVGGAKQILALPDEGTGRGGPAEAGGDAVYVSRVGFRGDDSRVGFQGEDGRCSRALLFDETSREAR